MSSQENHLYEFGPYVMDPRSRILLKDGATVRLTPKAFDTLLVLVEHAPQVVAKEQLLREVWPDIFIEEGSLSHNIHGLRKVLGDDSSEPRYIETIPKRGYRFVAPVKVSGADTAQSHVSDNVEVEETLIVAAPVVDKPTLAPVVTNPDTKRRMWAGVVAVALVGSAIAGFIFMKRAPRLVSPASPVTRAKTTLIRLTNNNAMDCQPVWSPDGSRVVFWSNRDGGKEIYVMDADGSNARRLTHNLAEDVNPNWSPDGRTILFDSDRDGNQEVYVMDADGGNQIRLTRNNAVDTTASWSPDGSLIAFASNRDTGPPYNPYNLDIYVMNADGSNVRRIVDDAEYDVGPQWSPDGRKILFMTGRNRNFDVYEMNADGTRQRNLTADNDKSDGAPAWSIDGHNIAFVRRIEGKDQVFVMDSAGGNLKQVTHNAATSSSPRWSPDGSKLIFHTDRDGNLEIYITSVDGELAQLTDDAADDLSPDWSPDGNTIAFSSNRNGKQHIYVMNADGSALTQITNSPAEDTEPAWAPDGKRIAFTSLRDGNKDVYVIEADGSNLRRLTDDPGVDSAPRWSVDGQIVFSSNRDGQSDIYVMDHAGQNVRRLTTIGAAGHAAWAPDGRRVAFVSRSREIIGGAYWLQVYVIDADGSNLKMITRSPNSTFVPKWSADGAALAFVVEYYGAWANIFEISAEGGNLKRLTAGPKFDGRPAYSPDGTKLAFESNRDGNYEIYVMSLR
jgi:Tol biopolymer transport system component/DNA-binding winged helix-turn-helix (wHTH) protein